MIDTNAIRAKIADIAVKGKLTADYVSESNIDTELLDMGIIPEDIAEKDIPYSLKDGWRWVRVADLGAGTKNSFADGPFGSNLKREHYTTDKQVRIIQLSNVGELGWKDDNEKYTTYEHLETIKRSEVESGNIVIAKMMPAGRAIIVPDVSKKYVLSSDCVKFVPNSKLNARYLYHAINSKTFRTQVLKDVHGIGRERTSLSKLKSYLLPIPPADEQHVIVKRIDAIYDLLNIIDNLQSQYASNLEVLKSKFIDATVRGKLTEQIPEDGNAEDLYNQIQDEKARLIKEGKIKEEKALPEITEGEIPFNIPKNWKWVRMSEILDVRDGTHDSPQYYESGIPMITSKNLLDGRIDYENTKFVSQKDAEKINKRSSVDDGDILFAMIGTIGNPVLVKKEREFVVKNVALFKNFDQSSLSMRYVYWYLMREQYEFRKIVSGGLQPFISLKQFRMHVMPLPPFAEQERITAKLELLLSQI